MTDQQFKGCVAENAFDYAASRRRVVSCKPNMDGVGCYDRVVDSGGRLSRVQVKAAVHATGEGDDRGYAISLYSRPGSYRPRVSIPYSPADVDYVAGFVEDADAWYILPVDLACSIGGDNPTVYVYPFTRDFCFETEQYRERWDFLTQPVGGDGADGPQWWEAVLA